MAGEGSVITSRLGEEGGGGGESVYFGQKVPVGGLIGLQFGGGRHIYKCS